MKFQMASISQAKAAATSGLPVFINASNSIGLSSNAGFRMIKFNNAATWGLPVLIKKSAITTPPMVVTGVNGKSDVTAETEAMGPGGIAAVGNVAGDTGEELRQTGLYKGKTGVLLYGEKKGLYTGKKGYGVVGAYEPK